MSETLNNGYYKMPNVAHHVAAKLDGGQFLYWIILRYSLGWHSHETKLSLSRLLTESGRSNRNAVIKSLQQMEALGLIQCVKNGRKTQTIKLLGLVATESGFEYEIAFLERLGIHTQAKIRKVKVKTGTETVPNWYGNRTKTPPHSGTETVPFKDKEIIKERPILDSFKQEGRQKADQIFEMIRKHGSRQAYQEVSQTLFEGKIDQLKGILKSMGGWHVFGESHVSQEGLLKNTFAKLYSELSAA